MRFFYWYSPFNPITALSNQIHKLIIEHGSSSILRDHLSMFKDQVVILEKQFDSLSSDNETLKSEKQRLGQENQELRSEIEQHKQPADYEMKLGCVTFHGDETLYCPKCFFDKSRKVPTVRQGRRFRNGSVCQSEIPTR